MPRLQTSAEFRTTGELAELLAGLPANTPIDVAEHMRVDPQLRLDVDEDRTVSAAMLVPLLQRRWTTGLDGNARRVPRAAFAVQLAAVTVGRDVPVPAATVPYCPHERSVAALHAGDLVELVDAHRELVGYAGEILGGEDGTLADAITDSDLRDAILAEGRQLLQAAARLATLRDRLAADGRTGD
jgi:hypothetical protein